MNTFVTFPPRIALDTVAGLLRYAGALSTDKPLFHDGAPTGSLDNTDENNLKEAILPTNTLKGDGDVIAFEAGFRTANNATTKRIRFYISASVGIFGIADSTVIALTNQAIRVRGYIIRTAVDAQVVHVEALVSPVGRQAWSLGLSGSAQATITPEDQSAIELYLYATSQQGVGAALDDVIQDYMTVWYMPAAG